MAGLKLQAVTKSWDGKTQVIQPLTLDVADGELYGASDPLSVDDLTAGY